MLRAAVVADQAAELEVRQRVHQLRQSHRLIARGHAAAGPDGDVHNDVGDDAGGLRGVVQIAGILEMIHRLDELWVPGAERHGASDLAGRHVGGRHQDLFDPVRGKDFGFAELRGADADRPVRELQRGNRRALISLPVRPAGHPGAGQFGAHGPQVLLEPVEVQTQGGRIEVPLGRRAYPSWDAVSATAWPWRRR